MQTTAPVTFTNLTEQSTFDIADPNLDPAKVAIGNFINGSISGTKFDDRNGNGVRDATEPGLSPPDVFTMFIDSNNDGALDNNEQSTQTGANGAFTFTNLGPAVILGQPNPATFNGTYLIRESPQPGWVQTTAPLPPIVLQSSQAVTGELIGNSRTASISGFKFVDADGDGQFNAAKGDTPGSGFTIRLNGPSGPRTTVTAADGTFTFQSLPPGNYTVTEQVPGGWTQTTPNPAAITLTATTSAGGVTFGNFKNVNLSGTKFNDVNGNGTFDGSATEPGLAGFTIQLLNAATNAVVASTTTNSAGAFSFTNVGPLPGGGNYLIREVPQAGWVQSTPLIPAFAPTSGTNITTFQIGNFQTFAATGTAYIDLNGDGVRDGADHGAPGFVIQVRNTAGTLVATATSAADGTYTIPNLGPGTFTVSEVPRNPYSITQGAAGYTFTGQSGSPATGLDFGNLSRAIIVVAADAGGPPSVVIRDAATNTVRRVITAYTPGFTGGVRVATGQFSGDATPDVVTAPGPGGGPHIRVFDGATGQVVREFMAYTPSFTGGVYVAIGDVNHDGTPDIITGAGPGGGPHVKVFDGATGGVIASFFAFSPEFTGGVRVAAGDVDGDGYADIITAAGPGGGPHVAVYSGRTGALIRSFFAYKVGFTGDVYVAAGDTNGDGFADIVTGAGEGGGPHLRVFDGTTNGGLLRETMAFGAGSPGGGGQLITTSVWSSGLRVATTDLNLDGKADIIVAPGRGQPPAIRVLDGTSFGSLLSPDPTFAFDPSFLGGVFVGGS